MYAISHAATVLALKRRWPAAGLWPLLLSVQAIELLWVVLVYRRLKAAAASGDQLWASALRTGTIPRSQSLT